MTSAAPRFLAPALIGVLIAAAIASAAPGDLDPSFGDGGIVVTRAAEDFTANGLAVAVQPDGKVLAGGWSVRDGSQDMRFTLFRYDGAGTLDPTFGTNGSVHTDVGTVDSQIFDLIVLPDGRIVAGGTTVVESNAGSYDFAVVRYTRDGAPDITFGSGGLVTTDYTSGYDVALAVGIQSDGKIVLAGGTSSDDVRGFALARYQADGALDPTFGDGGRVVTPFGARATGDQNERADAVLVQADGKIVAAGGEALARYEADGTLDPGFGLGGKVTTRFSGHRVQAIGISAIAAQPDGKLVVAGNAALGDGRFAVAVARYHTDGTLDETFGDHGIAASFPAPPESLLRSFRAVVVQPDGNIVAVGSMTGTFPASDVLVARYLADGTLDPTFGAGGAVTTSLGPDGDEGADAALDGNGKVVVAGTTFNPNVNGDLLVARYDLGPICGDGRREGAERCDDGNRTGGDGCSVQCLDECAPSPDPTCETPDRPGRSVLLLKRTGTANPLWAWKWRGASTTPTALGDPRASTSYIACLYDAGTGLRAALELPAARICRGTSCWTARANGFRYRDRDGGSTGVVSADLQARSDGRVGLGFKAAGLNVSVPDVARLSAPLTVQVKNLDGGACWQATYSSPALDAASGLRGTSD